MKNKELQKYWKKFNKQRIINKNINFKLLSLNFIINIGSVKKKVIIRKKFYMLKKKFVFKKKLLIIALLLFSKNKFKALYLVKNQILILPGVQSLKK